MMRVDAWGIQDGYEDAYHNWQTLAPRTLGALRASMGVDPDGLSQPPASPVRVVEPGLPIAWPEPGQLRLEDGAVLKVKDLLPADLPLGYHRFVPERPGQELLVIASPGACLLPAGRGWGWAAQLYATRSKQSWGIGDLADLNTLGAWSKSLGASLLMINPIDAVAPIVPQESSPYYPSSRRYRNPLYLRIEEVPGAKDLGEDLRAFVEQGRALNALPRIDRTAIFKIKLAALEKIFTRFQGSVEFDRYCAEQGMGLLQFAGYCSLCEIHGSDWHQWPSEFRSVANPAVQQFIASHPRVRFHQWLQWLIDCQLEAAKDSVAIVQDLPIGFDPSGADAWVWQDVLASGVSIGAPPDVYNTLGQNWGLPPWIPHRLRAAHYEPFIQTIRSALRHAGGLRIDHALGLFRLFWIPQGFGAGDGGFVRYPHEELLAIIALESTRAGAFVIGEDLGTTEPLVQQQLARHRLLSYRVLWFEDERPATYSELSLASVTTHDLPTIAGLWTGADLRAQDALKLAPNVAATDRIRDRLKSMTGLTEESSRDDVILETHGLLSEASSMLVMATLEDGLGIAERPNMPGTIESWPNWRQPLPLSLEAIVTAELPQAIAERLNARSEKLPDSRPAS